MRLIIAILLLLTCKITFSQSFLDKTTISIGGYIHEINPEIGLLNLRNYAYFSPEIGIEYQLANLLLSVAYRRSQHYGQEANRFVQVYLGDFDDATSYEEANEFLIYYHT